MEDEDIAIIDEVIPENNNESKAKKDQARAVTNSNNKKEEEKEICWFWKNRKCRYENNCKKEHPEQCKTMIEEGRCKNNRCKLIHPKICRNSFYKGYCNRGDTCWFVHPKKSNNQQNNTTNVGNWGNVQDRHNQQASLNHNWGNQNQLQNYTNKNFLEQWPQIGNNYNISNQMGRGSENQAMMQMMENMMQKVMGMENKIMRIETGWQFNRR